MLSSKEIATIVTLYACAAKGVRPASDIMQNASQLIRKQVLARSKNTTQEERDSVFRLLSQVEKEMANDQQR